jgi:hypothetical protein
MTAQHTPVWQHRVLRSPGGMYRFCGAHQVQLPIDRCIGAHGAALRRSTRAIVKATGSAA